MDFISRQEAISKKLKFYFTGKPCKFGHVSKRNVLSCGCVECQHIKDTSEQIKDKRRERYLNDRERYIEKQKTYALINKEKISEYQKTYRTNNRDTNIQYQREYYSKNKEYLLQYRKHYYINHLNYYKEYYTKYYSKNKELLLYRSKLYYMKHRHDILKRKSVYYTKNINKILIKNAARRKRVKQSTPKWVDIIAVEAIYSKCTKINKISRIKFHVDHIIPLRGKNVCGLHVESNLQIIPAYKNLSKGNSFEDVT